jgi:urease accessory protein UreH
MSNPSSQFSNQLFNYPITRLPDSGTRDRRPASVIGRRARVELTFGSQRGRTVLAHSYVEPPFRIGRALDFGSHMQVFLICSGPGVFGGDVLMQRVIVESGARVLLVSQSALQVHPNDAPDGAVLDSHYRVADGGELDCYWDALIPFAGARLRQRSEINLVAGSRMFWSDALMSGRVGRGEAWRFDELDHELRLSVDGSLQYLERYRLHPSSRAVDRTWMAGTAQYLGTALAYDELVTAARAESLQTKLASLADMRCGVDRIASKLLVGRLTASAGPPFTAGRTAVRDEFARPPLRRV